MRRTYVVFNCDGRLLDSALLTARSQGMKPAELVEFALYDHLMRLRDQEALPPAVDDLEDVWNDIHGFWEGHRDRMPMMAPSVYLT